MNTSIPQIHPSWCSLDLRFNSCTVRNNLALKTAIVIEKQIKLVESDVHAVIYFRIMLPHLSPRINFALATRKHSTSTADGGACRTKKHPFSPKRGFSTPEPMSCTAGLACSDMITCQIKREAKHWTPLSNIESGIKGNSWESY